MADMLGLLKGEQLVEISNDFNYMRATENFEGLKVFPLAKTNNMRLAIANLMDGSDIPVMAFVHALDSEARIGDRPNYQEVNFELLLIKEKLNQSEKIRKKMLDYGMSNAEKDILTAIYDDIANLISRVLTRMEVMACELLCTGKITIDENNAKAEIDYHLPTEHKIAFTGWSNPTTDVVGDLISIKRTSKNKIKKAYISEPIMGYIMANNAIKAVAASQQPIQFVTEEWTKAYLKAALGIEFIVIDGQYKTSAQTKETNYFFKQDVISFVTTEGALGRTFVTSSPEEDYGIAQNVTGYVAITQWYENDPAGVWTKASAIALPCPTDINSLYIATVGA